MKEVHELAKFFPPLQGDEFKALCKDVKEHGLINPIVLKDDQILDGVNRAKACDEVGTRPKYENFNGGNARQYVISQNILRRHLTPSQRAMLAAELAEDFATEPKNKGGRGKVTTPIDEVSASVGKSAATKAKDRSAVGRAAAALHVRPDIVWQAKRVIKEAPHLAKDVRAGKITVREALTQNLNTRGRERAIKVRSDTIRKNLQKENRQVAQYLVAAKAFKVAVKLAIGHVERFSAPEAGRFVYRQHEEIRSLMVSLEKAIKKSSA